MTIAITQWVAAGAWIIFAFASAQALESGIVIEGHILKYECGDNCYLTVLDSALNEHVGLCTAPLCRSWNFVAKMPGRFAGIRVRATVTAGNQLNGDAEIIGKFDAFSQIELLDSRTELTIDGTARSASLFKAFSAACSDMFRINLDKTKRAERAFLEIGLRLFGSKAFMSAVKKENSRRYREVNLTGRPQWCSYQQHHLQKSGFDDIFISAESVISAEDMTATLASMFVGATECDIERLYKTEIKISSMEPLIGRHGLKIDEFGPNGRYETIIVDKMKSVSERLRNGDLSCSTLIENVRRFLPEIFK